MDNNWQKKIGDIVRETYSKQGYKDIVIMIGGVATNKDIHTQIWYPCNTAGETDLRFIVFALLNHFFYEYNQ